MLKTIYDSVDEIPDGYAELYTEKNGKWELTGVSGIKTQSDIDRIQASLTKERNDHKATKATLATFEGINPEEVHTMATKLESAEAQLAAIGPNGIADPEKLEPIIAARVKQATGPLERDKINLERRVEALNRAVQEKDGEVVNLRTTITTGNLERSIRDAAIADKVLGTAIDDVVMRGLRVFELTEDNRIITKDVPGTTPGLSPKDWVADLKDKAPHFWPLSSGSGSRGALGSGPGSARLNPWSKEHWNLTAQGKYVRDHGEAKAIEAAESAGVKLGATKPAAA